MSLGKRTRKEVNYKEQVSDSHFFKMIEAGLDPNSEADQKRARRQNITSSSTQNQESAAAATETAAGQTSATKGNGSTK